MTPALVISMIALIAAVGGGYAIGASKVDTADIRKQAVTNKKIAKKTIKKSRVVNDTLTGQKINESTLGTVPSAQNAQTAGSAGVAGTARSTFDDTAISIPASTSAQTEALALDLPAGSYLLVGKTALAKAGLTLVQCSVSAGGDSDTATAHVDSDQNVTVAMTAIHTAGSASEAVLSCNNPGVNQLLLTNSRLTAIPFAAVENDPAG